MLVSYKSTPDTRKYEPVICLSKLIHTLLLPVNLLVKNNNIMLIYICGHQTLQHALT